MSNYRYIKYSPRTISVPLLPLISISIGSLLLFWVIWPIVSFVLFTDLTDRITTPLADEVTHKANAYENIDYTKVSNWLPRNSVKTTLSQIKSYTLTIPKLKIYKAIVRVGTDDLSTNLIHYGDTELPGKPGKAVIFGHSILPQFFDPKNYMSIFSLLPTLKMNDDIFVTIDGVDYRYKVSDIKVLDPDDITGLEQKYDNSYVTLVTCVPPGTYFKRLWLTARLVPYGKV